jgi:hypothetical protein
MYGDRPLGVCRGRRRPSRKVGGLEARPPEVLSRVPRLDSPGVGGLPRTRDAVTDRYDRLRRVEGSGGAIHERYVSGASGRNVASEGCPTAVNRQILVISLFIKRKFDNS